MSVSARPADAMLRIALLALSLALARLAAADVGAGGERPRPAAVAPPAARRVQEGMPPRPPRGLLLLSLLVPGPLPLALVVPPAVSRPPGAIGASGTATASAPAAPHAVLARRAGPPVPPAPASSGSP
jgi:hypothetical protein